MPTPQSLAHTFATLREMLAAQSGDLVITVDRPGDFQVGSPDQQDRIGRPLYVAGVRTRKHYVTYHLMPIYAIPRLAEKLSPGLQKRMQGKSCFNFTTIEADQVRELSKLTRTGIEAFRDIELPWAPQERATRTTAVRSSARSGRRAPRSPR